MSGLSVRMFGKLRVWCDDRLIEGLDSKAQELFCYLLLYRQRSHHREALASLLWSDGVTTQSRKYLRQALWQLQTALESQAKPVDSRLLLIESDWVHVNPEADLWLDVAVFEQAFTLAQGVPGRKLDDQKVQALQGAVELYQGELLEGSYQDWSLYERERYQNMYLATLNKLMACSEVHRDYEAGLAYGARLLHYDRAHERTHRRMMRLHYLSGDRTAALRQYERCVTALTEELGVKPARRTVALYEQIRADRLGNSTLVIDGAPQTREASPNSLAKVLDRLRYLSALLDDLQQDIQRDI